MGDRGKHDDDDVYEEESIFDNITTTSVLQDARKVFNERNLRLGDCSRVLTQILYLISQGEVYTSEESIELFFSVTKLFQSDNIHLRRMIYLVIKDLNVDKDNSLIVVSCLSKDMTNEQDLYRANSIRVLAKIIDSTMVSGIERFLKQAIVDKNPFVVISTLVASQHILKRTGAELVKRWVNEVQEALASKSPMAQYNALALLYKIKEQDRLAISKIVTALARKPLSGTMAQCLHIRIVHNLLKYNEGKGSNAAELLQFLQDCLRNRNFAVMYEAAKALCSLPFLTAVQVSPAVNVLHDFLSSPVPAQRFAAVKTLSKVVVQYPLVVTSCSVELERLITDNNRNIATLAITTLLKTGDEDNVDRLMKSITGFMNEISDDFKVVLVEAIKTLCLKFPHKHHSLINFLAASMRQEGGFTFKKTLVTTLLTIIDKIEEAKDVGLDHFCEFIEDCEFPELSVKVLHMLGEKGPLTDNPSKYIRYVFNRLILEVPSVRAASVSCLAKFGVAVPNLTDSIIVLLTRCLNDVDDEVRDRAVFYLNLLKTTQRSHAKSLVFSEEISLTNLECSLQVYLEKCQDKPFNLMTDIVEAKQQDEREERGTFDDTNDAEEEEAAPVVSNAVTVEKELALIPGVETLGGLVKSCDECELTESETEYVVTCVRHIYPKHVVSGLSFRYPKVWFLLIRFFVFS